MKTDHIPQVENAVIIEAVTLLYPCARYISDTTHLILTVALCGGNFFIDKQRKYREVKHFVQGHTAKNGGIWIWTIVVWILSTCL